MFFAVCVHLKKIRSEKKTTTKKQQQIKTKTTTTTTMHWSLSYAQFAI
jgi:hypothetical protein